jgi:hypothetical protein
MFFSQDGHARSRLKIFDLWESGCSVRAPSREEKYAMRKTPVDVWLERFFCL